MKQQTITALLELNRTFYAQVADSFNDTRQGIQPGWEQMLTYLPQAKKLMTVLDMGCGNGRLGTFLYQSLPHHLAYTGIDSSRKLLQFANRALSGLPHRQLNKQELVNFTTGLTHDVVAAFGVLHHIPGRETRLKFMRQLAGMVAPGGRLMISVWLFNRDRRVMERTVAPPQPSWDLEANDYFLGWQQTKHIRYCHLVDTAEIAALQAATQLPLLATYSADGRQGDLAQYLVFSK